MANALMAVFPVFVLADVDQSGYWIFCLVLAAVAVAITLVRGPCRRSGGVLG
ncbi:MAG: hypothetical protein HY829_12300 [Actinobacteria bacterium]|nr:hypothetical protein [Actinomycetota bacterium]